MVPIESDFGGSYLSSEVFGEKKRVSSKMDTSENEFATGDTVDSKLAETQNIRIAKDHAPKTSLHGPDFIETDIPSEDDKAAFDEFRRSINEQIIEKAFGNIQVRHFPSFEKLKELFVKYQKENNTNMSGIVFREMQKQIDDLEEELAQGEKERIKMRDKSTRLMSDLLDRDYRLKDMEDETQAIISRNKRDMVSLNRRITELNKTNADLTQQLNLMRLMVKGLQAIFRSDNQERSDVELELEGLKPGYDVLVKQLDATFSHVDYLKTEIARLEEEVGMMKARDSIKERYIRELESTVETQKKELASLKALAGKKTERSKRGVVSEEIVKEKPSKAPRSRKPAGKKQVRVVVPGEDVVSGGQTAQMPKD